MTALASWRWTAPKIDTDLWFRKMVTLRAPPLTVGQFDASSTAKSAFYDALLHKCLNLYGGSGRAADPLALARHPWTLTTHEFASAFQAITGGDLPSTVPDERRSMSLRYGLIAAAPSAAGIALGIATANPIGAGAATGVAVAVATAGVAIDVSRDDERVRQLGMLRENLAGYATVYRKEAAYRAKEGDAAMNS